MRLEVNDLHVRYGRVHAVRGVSLRVEDGEVVAVLGANGAAGDGQQGHVDVGQGLLRVEGHELAEPLGVDLRSLHPGDVDGAGLEPVKCLALLFRNVGEINLGWLRPSWPEWWSLDWKAALLSTFAMLAMFRWHVGMLPTLAVCGAAGLILKFAF